ncbi:RNA-directed DNA polymerase from mobile element jockey [Anthophora plagiata]
MDSPFNLTELTYTIHTTNSRSAPGPDKIEYNMIKNLSTKSRLLLLDILNEYFTSGQIPNSWKLSHVYFIPKNNRANYRPITLASNMCKFFERLVKNRLSWWCETLNKFNNNKFGFRKGRSCQDNIGKVIVQTEKGLTTNQTTIAAMLDVSSAFDNVNTKILLEKLTKIGIPKNTLQFIANTIENRQMKIVGDPLLIEQATHRIVSKGVPQGGVLSPFSTTFLTTNTSIHNATQAIEKAIESIEHNLNTLGLELSIPKTEIVVFSKNNTTSHPIEFRIGENNIRSKNQTKFLGLLIDKNLRFDNHIRNIQTTCNKTTNIIKFLRGTWWGSNPQTLLHLYKTLIRARLEYACQWYYPVNNKKLASSLERIQLNAIKLALGLRRTTANNVALAETKLHRLKERAKYLATRYITKTVCNKANNMAQTIENLVTPTLAMPETVFNLSRKKSLIQHCWKQVKPFMNQTDTEEQLPNYSTDLHIQLTSIPTNTSMAPKWRKQQRRGVCPGLGIQKSLSLNKNVAIFTAEPAALKLAAELASQNRNQPYVIWTDCLSIIQSFHQQNYSQRTNKYLRATKEAIINFNHNNAPNTITVAWIPAHRGITGNEETDKIAKEATKQDSNQAGKISLDNLNSTWKNQMWEDTNNYTEANLKGTLYFQTFYENKRKPWFHNKKLPKYITSWVTRYRSNHYNLAASLARLQIKSSSECERGADYQDLNHILWNCPLYTVSRKKMLYKLQKQGYLSLQKIEPFLQNNNINIIKTVSSFLKTNKINI